MNDHDAVVFLTMCISEEIGGGQAAIRKTRGAAVRRVATVALQDTIGGRLSKESRIGQLGPL
jgi:hypothetical protein